MKNRLRKMLSLVLAVVIAMSAISLNTFAATILDIKDGSTNKLYVDWYDYSYNFNGRLNTSTYGQIIKLNVGSPTGQVAYCIQSSKDAWTSDYTAQKTYNLLSLTQQQNLKHALIYGYQGTTKYGYNADTERIATSIVTWNICDGWFNNSSESTAVGIFTEDMSSSMATNVKACYNKIKEQMLSHLTIPSYAVKPTVTNVPKQKMTTNSDGTFTITLTDSKNVSKYYDWQTAIKNYSYLSITTDTEGKLVIKSTKPIPSGSAITLTAKRDSNKYQSNIIDVAPMYMISGSGSQSSATYVQDYDPSEAKIAIYSDSLGTAQIKKVWEHKHDSSSTQASNSDIYFTIKNSSGTTIKATGKAGSYTYSASGSVSQFRLNSSNTFLVKSLPAGTYTVTEHGKNSDGSIPYYTRTGGVSKTVTVTAGGTGTVTFTNTRNTGNAQIVKEWTKKPALSRTEETSLNQKLKFYIKTADGNYVKISGTVPGTYTFAGTSTTAQYLLLNPGTGTFTVSDMPTGKYTVTETNVPSGYTAKNSTQTITVKNNETASVTFNNVEDTGTGKIIKKWVSSSTLTAAEKANLNSKVYFTVKAEDGKYVVPVVPPQSSGVYTYSGKSTTEYQYKTNSGGTFTISNLPTGTYSVTEHSSAAEYSPKTQTKTVTVRKGSTGSVTFTNKSAATLVIRKHFSDEDNLTDAELQEQYKKVSIEIMCLGTGGTTPPYGYFLTATKLTDGKYNNVNISGSGGKTKFKLDSNGELQINMGGMSTAPYSFRVIETYDGTDYTTDEPKEFSMGDGNPNNIIELDDILIENKLKPGTVVIDKEFLGVDGNSEIVTDAQLAQVEFEINDSKNDTLSFSGSAGNYTYDTAGTVTQLKLGTDSKLTVSGLPSRQTYTIAETSGATGYSFTIDPVTFEITPNGTVSKKFTNKAMTGNIVIQKHTLDNVLSGWKFRVHGTALTGQTYDKTYTTDAQGKIIISNLRIGTYTVEEVTTGVVGYITPENRTVEVKYNKTVTVNMQNTPYGNINIKKVNSKTGEIVSGAKFAIYESDGVTPAKAYTSSTDSTLIDAVITEAPAGSGIYVCNNLPITDANGTQYVIKETSAPEGYFIDKGAYTVTLETAGTTVLVSNNGKGTFDEDEYGSASITKIWSATDKPTAAQIAELEKSVKFTIKNENGKYLTFTGGNGTYTYSGVQNTESYLMLTNGKFIANMIPTGTYTVTEINNNKDYSPATQSKTVKITRNTTGKAEFINTRKTGNSEIVKIWKATVTPSNTEIAELEKNVQFTVKNSNGKYLIAGTASNGKYVYVGVQNTPSYFKLINSKIAIDKIPTGTYEVTEINNAIGSLPKTETAIVTVTENATSRVNFTNRAIEGSVHVTKIDKDYPDNKLKGAVFTVYKDVNGNSIYEAGTDTFYKNLTALTGDKLGEYQLDNIPYGDYLIKETKAPQCYVLDENYYPFSIRNENDFKDIQTLAGKGLPNSPQTGSLTITKKTPDNILEGWKFRVELVSSEFKDYTYDEVFTTDKNGNITITGLRIGKYKVTEITTGIENYFFPDAQDVDIKFNEASDVSMTNTPYGTITLRKADLIIKDKLIPGATFAVYKDVNENGTYEADVDTFVNNLVDNNGIYTLEELEYGKYLVKETATPEGYLVDEKYYPVFIDKAGANVVVSTDNSDYYYEVPIIGNVEITKVDEEYPDNKLKGAEFTVYAKDKKTVIGKLSEVEAGVYRLEGLRYGEYYVKETKAPDYFVQDVNYYYFQIVNDGETVIVTNDKIGEGTFINSPEKGEIKIVKTSYNNKVEGFKFEVSGTTYTGQTFKKTYTTDKDGIIRITDLRAGEYTIHEVKDSASAGYLLPEDKQLTIDRDGAMLVANMHNSKLPDNPPTGASEDSFTQTAVIIISMVMMSAAVVLVFPLSKRKRKR